MTIEKLDAVRHASRRIRMIQQSIKELDELTLPSKVGGVHSSSPSSPVEQHFRQKERLLARLETEQAELLELIEEVYAWMDTIPIKIANIVYARFILGNTWKKVARMCYDGYTNESVPCNALNNYLNKINNSKCDM